MKKIKSSILLSVLILILISPSIHAEKVIDPHNYNLILGKILEFKGEAFIINENGTTSKIKNNDSISSSKIKRFILEYNDNAQTLIGGRKEIKEKLTIKTLAGSRLKISLIDNDQNDNYIILGPNSEASFSVQGGCLYSSEHDGEGYDKNTLKWREIKKDITWKLLSGNAKVLYRKNDKYILRAPTTENANIYIDNSIDNIEYEVIILKGNEATKQEVEVESLNLEMNAQIEAIKNNYLLVYKIESIDQLPKDIKIQLENQIDMFKESYQKAEATMNEMMNQTIQIVTILKVYKGEAKIENTKLKNGQRAMVKGDIQRASSPENI